MITRQAIQHIAHLARIELTEKEEERFEKELSAILGFVETLNELNTDDVEPMTGGTHLVNVMRKDAARDETLEGTSSALIDAAPDKKGRWIRVRSVFDA